MSKTTVSAVKDKYGKIGYQVALVDDITREMEAEAQLKASEER